MELKAVKKSIATDWNTGRALITFEVEQSLNPKELESMKDKTLRLTVKQWREKRTLDANNYYWKLLSDLARVLSKERLTSSSYLHNMLLRQLGMLKLIDGKPIMALFPDTQKTELMLLDDEIRHYKPTSQTTEVAGEAYRVYMELKASHEMDTKEFSDLLNALISECNEQGIETLTPDELSHLEGFKELHEDDRQNKRLTG